MIREHEQRNIALLGCTGSIGCSTLDVVRRHPDRFRIVSLVAGKNMERLTEQIREFKPRLVVTGSPDDARTLRDLFPGMDIASGKAGILSSVEMDEADTVVSAITGTVALKATFRAIDRGLRICLANKETLVAAGDLINHALQDSRASLIPIDSEQSAIFQALSGLEPRGVRRMILTASGGPFLGFKSSQLREVNPEQALAHPRWRMGRKISIDSATLMNKGLEMIEARFLFQLPGDKIDVWVHPQSIVHSLVEFEDCSLLAQLGVTDMRLPIQYALTHPQRLDSGFPRLDLTRTEALTFREVDHENFPAIRLARDVLAAGGSGGAVFNAANEVAVDAFMERKIRFTDIVGVVADTVAACHFPSPRNPDEVEEIIAGGRRLAEKVILERRM